MHADYLQVCLVAKNYKAGVAMVEEDAVDIDPSGSGLVPRDVLRYSYYAGLVRTGLKDYRRALDYFLAFTVPALCVSAIMLEAYKKYVLVALLVHGQLPGVPKYVSMLVQRHLKAAAAPYHELAAAYASRSTDELHRVAQLHLEVFQRDRSFGLVKQVIVSLVKRNIQRSTQTYVTISLADIADAVKLTNAKDAEKRILRMIEAGEVFATISQKNGMVSFHDEPEQYDTTRTTRQLDGALQRTISLGGRLRTADEEVGAVPAFLHRTALRDAARPPWGAADDLADELLLAADRPPGMI